MARPSSYSDACRAGLLDLDGPAGLLELALELVGLLALHALLDGLRRLVDERLGLLQADAGRRRSGLGRGGDAELLLERLDALSQLEHADALELVDPFAGAGSHVSVLLFGSGGLFGCRFLGGLFSGCLGGRLLGALRRHL